jgi:hypothetical protein
MQAKALGTECVGGVLQSGRLPSNTAETKPPSTFSGPRDVLTGLTNAKAAGMLQVAMVEASGGGGWGSGEIQHVKQLMCHNYTIFMVNPSGFCILITSPGFWQGMGTQKFHSRSAPLCNTLITSCSTDQRRSPANPATLRLLAHAHARLLCQTQP